MAAQIAVLDYGIGNLRSAEKALVHLGADARLQSSPDKAARADGMVLPGVGAFGACMAALKRSGLADVAVDSIARGVPFMGICIGFQMLFEGSDESPGVDGLGVMPGFVRELSQSVKRPQMQWNKLKLRPEGNQGLLRGIAQEAWVYFVHSYAPDVTDDVVATCEYGGEVTAAAERGCIWGTQFHPEKSGTMGLSILRNFVERCETKI